MNDHNKVVDYHVLENITRDDLDAMESLLSLEEIRELKRKTKDVIGNMFLKGAKDRALAEMIFKLGYLSSYMRYPPKQEKIDETKF